MRRATFESKEMRNAFFEKALSSSGFKTWKRLYNDLRIPKSVFEKYKNGALSLPERLYDKLKIKFDDSSLTKLQDEIIFIESNWGQIKGGKEAYKKNKISFSEGRLRGIEALHKNDLRINMETKLTRDLCYIIGLYIGDGFSNKYGNYYLTQFVGHKTKERDFYEKIIFNILLKLFSVKPKIIIDERRNAIRLNIYSKSLLELFHNRFKIPLGIKFDKVEIPDEILNSDKYFLRSFITGLFDAEACVFLDKRKIYSKAYPRISFHINNKLLTKQVYETLTNEDIIVSVSSDFKMLNIYGEKNLKNFLRKIKLKNPKHIKKLKLAKLI